MNSEWAKFTDLLSVIVDNRGRTCPVGPIGLPLIATNCISSEVLYPRYETTRFVSEETYRTWFRGHPQAGDILFVCKGSPGRTNWVPDPVDFCIAQDMVAVRADPSKVYPKYLFAALRSQAVQSQIGNMHVGTMIPHFKKGDFDKLLIPLLDARSQVAVGDLYFELSERINLLRETNSTLEAIAQALFKSWFVDFDPVRAKMEGRALEGMDETTAALFPAAFEQSALGEIPVGWRLGEIGELLELTKGCSYKGEGLTEADGAYMFNLGCFNAHRVYATEKVKRYVGEYKPRHEVRPGDLIIANTDMTQARDILGRPAFVPDGFEPGFVSHHVFKVSVKTSNDKPAAAVRAFLFFALQQESFRERAIGFATGTTVLALPAAAVLNCPCSIPPGAVLRAFWNVGQTLFDRLRENERVAETLADLRGTLLPRLISGQLRLPEAYAARFTQP
jgi:type I restriction enzyme, S subunit